MASECYLHLQTCRALAPGDRHGITVVEVAGQRSINSMIRFILLQNRAGKTRLAKYYIPLDDSEKHSLEYEVHRLIATRDPKFTNFVEVSKSKSQLDLPKNSFVLDKTCPLTRL